MAQNDALSSKEVFKIDTRIENMGIDERFALYRSIFKLVAYSYRDEAKSFEEYPSEDHIMIDISRIRHDMFPNKELL